MIKNLFKTVKGFSLIEVSIAIAFVSILGVSVMQMSQLGSKDNLRLNMARRALNQRSLIESNLKNPVAWNSTVLANSSFSCFLNAAGCNLNAADPNGYYNFIVYDSDPLTPKVLSFDPINLTTRISIINDTCALGTPNPSESCPLKFEAKWRPVCATYPCTNAQVEILVALNYDFVGKVPFDNHRYDITMIRDFDSSSIQSACLLLNGTYNPVTGTCTPKQANKSCAAMGSPFKIVSTVQADGSITCENLYSGACDPDTQVVSAMNALGQISCAARPANPPSCSAGAVDCVGAFSSCSATLCGTSGTRSYAITTPAANGGLACPFTNGYSEACNAPPCAPVNCVGGWGSCSAACDAGIQTYTITTPASGGGTACSNADGDTQACNNGPCGTPIDCVGSWGACDSNTGEETYTITIPESGGGASCPALHGQKRNCDVDCVGSWSACQGLVPNSYKEFIITITKKNNGADCSHPNGATDTGACDNTTCDVGGSWSACDPNTGLQTWNHTPGWPGAHSCVEGFTRTCAVDCVGSFGACQGSVPNEYEEFHITVTAKNGGASCQYAEGYQQPAVCTTDCTNSPFPLSSWDSSMYNGCCSNAYGPGAGAQFICDGPGSQWTQISNATCSGQTNTTCGMDFPYGFPPPHYCYYTGPGTICTDR